MKYLKSIGFGLLVSLFFPFFTFASSGACSGHGGVSCSLSNSFSSVVCNDGWTDSSTSYYNLQECKAVPCDPAAVGAYSSRQGMGGSGMDSAAVAACNQFNQNLNAQKSVSSYVPVIIPPPVLKPTPVPTPLPTPSWESAFDKLLASSSNASVLPTTSTTSAIDLLISQQASSTPEVKTIVFPRILKLGMRGNDVTDLQNFLIAAKFLKTQATGYFGTATKSALQKFQKSVGLKQSGILDSQTIIKMNN